MDAQCTPHPLKSFLQELTLTRARERIGKKTVKGFGNRVRRSARCPRADQLVRIDVDDDMVRLHLMLLGMGETVMFPADEHCITSIRSRMTLTSAPRSEVAVRVNYCWPARRCLSAARWCV